jgi:acyl-CoA dehydrogenase
MYEWSDEHQMVRDAIRSFVEAEIKPNLEELEHGDTPPYDVLRKLYRTFGLDAMAASQFDARIEREKAEAAGEEVPERGSGGGGADGGMMMIPIIELCRYCPGMVTAMGVSMVYPD